MTDIMEVEKNDLPETPKEEIKTPMANKNNTVNARAAKKIIQMNRNKIEAGIVQSLEFIYARMTDMDNKLTTLASSFPKNIAEPIPESSKNNDLDEEYPKKKKRKIEEPSDDTEEFEGDIKKTLKDYGKQMIITAGLSFAMSFVGLFIKNLYNRKTNDGEDLPNYSTII